MPPSALPLLRGGVSGLDPGSASRKKRYRPPLHSIVARDKTVVWYGAITEIQHDLVDVTPSPALGRVVAFNDRGSWKTAGLTRLWHA